MYTIQITRCQTFFSSFCDLSVDRAIYNLLNIGNHHPPLDFNLSLNLDTTFNLISSNHNNKYNFRKGNYDDLNTFLISIDWVPLFTDTDANQCVATFYHILYSAINIYVPLTTDDLNTFPVWFTSYIKFKLFEKKELI